METEKYALIRSGETFKGDKLIGLYAKDVAMQLQKDMDAADSISSYHVLPESKLPESMKN